jgi:hypothetical protein
MKVLVSRKADSNSVLLVNIMFFSKTILQKLNQSHLEFSSFSVSFMFQLNGIPEGKRGTKCGLIAH